MAGSFFCAMNASKCPLNYCRNEKVEINPDYVKLTAVIPIVELWSVSEKRNKHKQITTS